MAYDDRLAARVRTTLTTRVEFSEKKMFGGLAFMFNGHMFCGLVKDELMVRVGPGRYEKALKEPFARPMDFTGRPMVGYVFVAPEGCHTGAALARWVDWGVEFARSLPPKPLTRPRRPRSKNG